MNKKFGIMKVTGGMYGARFKKPNGRVVRIPKGTIVEVLEVRSGDTVAEIRPTDKSIEAKVFSITMQGVHIKEIRLMN